MTRKKRYSAEFKHEALRRANEECVTDTMVAEELGFSTRQLRRWRDEAKKDGENAGFRASLQVLGRCALSQAHWSALLAR